MTPITKDALIERGFEPTSGNWHKLTKGNWSILVHNSGFQVCVSEGKIDMVSVPNCTTLEQLDQLILMFLK